MSVPVSVPPDGQWNYEYITPHLVQAERVREVLFSGRTAYQDVLIIDGASFGRSLLLDGKTQSTEADEFVYHEGLVQPAMVAHPNPRTVFIAGGGEGATARDVLSHRSVAKTVMVDIDREVVELCREYLPNHHRGAFEDSRLELRHGDALEFLEKSGQRFDDAIIDVPDPLEVGPAYLLFTREFYELVRDRLTPEGMVVTQAGPTGPLFHKQCFTAVAHTVGEVFPAMYAYEVFVPSFGGTWGFVIGSLGPDPVSMPVVELDRRIAERVDGRLRFFDGTTQRGLFSLPKYLREGLANETRVITRDEPLFVV